MQLHLKGNDLDAAWPYDIDPDYMNAALAETAAAGVDLEVLPFKFDSRSIHKLLDLGIRWYATDEPAKFVHSVEVWKG